MKFYVDGNYFLNFDGNFPKTKKSAILAAWEKWQTIVKFHKDNPDVYSVYNIHANTCALCQLYLNGTECFKCPIYKATGEHLCQNTPYVDYMNAATPEDKLYFARKEAKFIKSLLKK